MNETVLRSHVESCPECHGIVIHSDGEVVCSACGLVLGQEQEEDKVTGRRDGLTELGSFVGRSDFGTLLQDDESNGRFAAICRMVEPESRVVNCAKLTGRVCEKLGLPRVVLEEANHVSRKILEDDDAPPVPLPAISAYSVLLACRRAGISHVKIGTIVQTYRDMGYSVKASRLVLLGSASKEKLPAVSMGGLLQAAAKHLWSDRDVANRLSRRGINAGVYFRELLHRSRLFSEKAKGTRGFSPRTVAAGSIYLAAASIAPRMITQREASSALGISSYTVREFCGWYRSTQLEEKI